MSLDLAGMGAKTGGILITHADIDHIAGVAALAEGTGAEVWAPVGEADYLRAGETRGGMHVTPYDPEHTVTGGDEITVAGIAFEVIDVPGHSRGHVAFHHEGELFAGDLLLKNFGMTRYGRVVFYDYDEIEYLVDCRFRRMPEPPPGFDDTSAEVWYPVGPHDV